MYNVLAGDTFALISRKLYGVETGAGVLAKANPGVAEPLTPGTVLAVPVLPDAPTDKPPVAPSDSPAEVSLLIGTERFRFWNTLTITRAIDSMDTAEFGSPFEPDNLAFREAFKPFRFDPFSVAVGGKPFITGTKISGPPVLTPEGRTVTTSGYSLPGVLNDCTAPASAYPIEYNDQSLSEIATALAAPFGLAVEFGQDPGPRFVRVALDPAQTVLSFLIGLAHQRNFVITSTPRGALRFTRSVAPGSPVARLQEGAAPVLSVTPSFNPQSYFSHVTGLEPTEVGLFGSQFTVKNPHLPGVVRPHTFKAQDTEDSTVKAAVDAKISRMFANMVSYSVPVASWFGPDDNLWQPNTTVTLLAPGAMIYTEYEFIVRSVQFSRTPEAEQATLNLVLPGAFSGEIPERLPWD